MGSKRVSIELFVTCPGALFADRHRSLCVIEIRCIYSTMLKIRYNDEDSKNNVKCLGIRRRFPMLNIRYNDEDSKNNVVSLFTFLDPPPS